MSDRATADIIRSLAQEIESAWDENNISSVRDIFTWLREAAADIEGGQR